MYGFTISNLPKVNNLILQLHIQYMSSFLDFVCTLMFHTYHRPHLSVNGLWYVWNMRVHTKSKKELIIRSLSPQNHTIPNNIQYTKKAKLPFLERLILLDIDYSCGIWCGFHVIVVVVAGVVVVVVAWFYSISKCQASKLKVEKYKYAWHLYACTVVCMCPFLFHIIVLIITIINKLIYLDLGALKDCFRDISPRQKAGSQKNFGFSLLTKVISLKQPVKAPFLSSYVSLYLSLCF